MQFVLLTTPSVYCTVLSHNKSILSKIGTFLYKIGYYIKLLIKHFFNINYQNT